MKDICIVYTSIFLQTTSVGVVVPQVIKDSSKSILVAPPWIVVVIVIIIIVVDVAHSSGGACGKVLVSRVDEGSDMIWW